MIEKHPLLIKICARSSGNFWRKYFNYERIEKMLPLLVKKIPLCRKLFSKTGKNVLEINLDNFRRLIEGYFSSFNTEPKEKRNNGLVKLIEADLNYKLYLFLDYPSYNDNRKFRQSKRFLRPMRFDNDTSFLNFFEKIIYKNNLKGKKIIVKPNFVSPESYPETTDKKLLASIVSILKKKQPYSLKILEGPSIFYDDSFLKKIKIGNYSIENTLFSKNLVRVGSNRSKISFLIEKDILEADFLINLACLKKHLSAGFSASKKNLMGLLPSFERIRFHRNLNLGFAIDFLAEKISPVYNIVDAREILDNAQMKKLGGKVKRGKGIYFSTDCFELDRIAINDNFNE